MGLGRRGRDGGEAGPKIRELGVGVGVRFVHGYEDEIWNWRMGDVRGEGLREEETGMGTFGDYVVDWGRSWSWGWV